MEELQKQVREILNGSLTTENTTEEIANALDKCEATNHEIARLIMNAYSQGIDRYFMDYIRNESTVTKVKERLLNDFIKGW